MFREELELKAPSVCASVEVAVSTYLIPNGGGNSHPKDQAYSPTTDHRPPLSSVFLILVCVKRFPYIRLKARQEPRNALDFRGALDVAGSIRREHRGTVLIPSVDESKGDGEREHRSLPCFFDISLNSHSQRIDSLSTSSSPRQNETTNPPSPASASPPISSKSSSHDSAWFVPHAVPSSKASSPSGGRLHKRSGFQSGPDLGETIAERAKDSSQQLRLIKSGKHLDVGMGNGHQKRGVASAIHSRPPAWTPSPITTDLGESAKSDHRMSKVGSFHLAIVTPAREDDVIHLRSTKRERDNEDGDKNGSKDGAKRPKYRKDISFDDPNPRRKGILKDPRRKASVSNRKRRVRWAERLEDHNYPNEFKGIKTVRQNNPGVKFVHEAHGGNWDASYVSDALPEGLRDRSQKTSMNSPALVPTYQESQRSSGSDFTAIPSGDWFSTFLKTLSEKEIHDLLAAYESLHQLVLPVNGVPGGPATSPPSASSELPPTAASGSEGHGSTTLDRRLGIVNPDGIVLQSPQLPGGLSGERVLPAILSNQDQAVPDLSTSPDLSDHSLTPPSPALNRFDVAMDEDVNLILPGGEHVGEGLDAKAALFSEDPTRLGSLTSAYHCGSNLGLTQRGGSGMGFEDQGNKPTPRTPGAPLEKKHEMENELAAQRITSSASMGKARKKWQSDSTKKLLGPNRTAS